MCQADEFTSGTASSAPAEPLQADVGADAKKTCATCQHIGRAYWGHHSDYGGLTHHCLMEAERRQDAIKPTGDLAQDFMVNFRSFFDAKANNAACRYYEYRKPVSGELAAILQLLADTDGKSAFEFFSRENDTCESMDKKFVERDEYAAAKRKPSDGTRDWMLTEVGKVEAARLPASAQLPIEEAHRADDEAQLGRTSPDTNSNNLPTE